MNNLRAGGITSQAAQLRVLSEDQCREIFQATVRVLERTGIEVQTKEGLEILRSMGAKIDGTRARLSPYLVENALRKAPKQITIYDVEGNPHLHLSARNGKSYWAPGTGSLSIIDRHTNEHRLTTYHDACEAALVIEAMPNMDVAVNICNVNDHDARASGLWGLFAMIQGTNKPYSEWHHNDRDFRIQQEMFFALAGGRDKFFEKPFVIANDEPLSPLVHSAAELDRSIARWRLGIPAAYGATVMPGASSPTTMAGSIVVALADTLAGLVIAQEVNPDAVHSKRLCHAL